MSASDLQSAFTIFILFFGVSLLDALQGGNWKKAAFWLAIGTTFLILGGLRKTKNVS